MIRRLLSPNHNLLAHFDQSALRIAVGEDADSFDGLVCIFLCEGAGLFEAVGLGDDLAGL